MTLKEKFLPFVDYIDLINDIPDKEGCGLRNADKCVEIADEYAIGFTEWCFRHYSEIPCEDTFELLEIYKKEKGL
jgi:hypothetical protein